MNRKIHRKKSRLLSLFVAFAMLVGLGLFFAPSASATYSAFAFSTQSVPMYLTTTTSGPGVNIVVQNTGTSNWTIGVNTYISNIGSAKAWNTPLAKQINPGQDLNGNPLTGVSAQYGIFEALLPLTGGTVTPGGSLNIEVDCADSTHAHDGTDEMVLTLTIGSITKPIYEYCLDRSGHGTGAEPSVQEILNVEGLGTVGHGDANGSGKGNINVNDPDPTTTPIGRGNPGGAQAPVGLHKFASGSPVTMFFLAGFTGTGNNHIDEATGPTGSTTFSLDSDTGVNRAFKSTTQDFLTTASTSTYVGINATFHSGDCPTNQVCTIKTQDDTGPTGGTTRWISYTVSGGPFNGDPVFLADTVGNADGFTGSSDDWNDMVLLFDNARQYTSSPMPGWS